MNHHDKYLQEEVFRLSDTIKGSDLADLIKACQEPTAVCLYLVLILRIPTIISWLTSQLISILCQ